MKNTLLIIVGYIVIKTCSPYSVFIDEKEAKYVGNSQLIPENLDIHYKPHKFEVKGATGKHYLQLVSNFPTLEVFEMKETEQKFLPTFKNVEELYEVDMSNNKFLFIDKEALSKTNITFINFDLNEITRIEENSFNSNVKTLSIACNQLTTFNPNWFEDKSSLTILNLEGNLLTTIDPNQFKPMTNLNYLKLGHNGIESIEDGAFSNTKKYLFLDISNNNLKELSENIFDAGQVFIDFFKINNNNLTFLTNNFYDRINIVNNVSVHDNPWQCKCWFDIKKWIPNNVKIWRPASRPICVAPLGFNEHCVHLVSAETIQHFNNNVDRPNSGKDHICNKDYRNVFDSNLWPISVLHRTSTFALFKLLEINI